MRADSLVTNEISTRSPLWFFKPLSFLPLPSIHPAQAGAFIDQAWMSVVALERQIRPIYDALDTGSNKSAIVTCNKLLKKHPQNGLVKALKALALVRSQKVEESLVLCDEVLASKTTDDATLSAMMHVLRGLGRHKDMITMFEEAYKQQPNNEDLGAQTFFANVRTGNWKVAQQISTKMHKQFHEDRYLYWSVICAILQANDPITPPPMRTLLYKLAHRLVASSPTPSYLTADRFHMHIYILRELQMFEEANTLLESDVGKSICSTSLVCDEVRRNIWQLRGLWIDEGNRAEQRILENRDRNWLEFISVLDATFSYLSHPTSSDSGDARSSCKEHIARTKDLFSRVAQEDGRKDRSGLLGLLELERRAQTFELSSGDSMNDLLEKYYEQVGDKACCFEDLKPFVALETDDLTRWTEFLDSRLCSVDTLPDILRTINAYKLLRYNLREDELTVEAEGGRAELYTEKYLEGLPLGKDLADTELQPADDLAILAGQTYVATWKLSDDEAHLFKAAALLEFASSKSKQSFQIRLMLVRIYRLLGAPSLALEQYRQINVKQVQNDTLSHFVLSRASMFSLAATGDITYASECMEASHIYLSNSQDTAEFIVKAFMSEKYSQIPDFIVFEDRLDNSLQRDIIKVEHVRMRLVHEQITSDVIDMELIELKFIFDRVHHDNRDFEILPNYQPRCTESFNEQTLMCGKAPGAGWLRTFLRLYIRAFQQASDLDDTVEDKLLIGDRPKASNDPEKRVPIKEQVCTRKQEELEELSPDELSLFDFAASLADWLGPHHDHIRPPPSAVLAEAAKQTELKTGFTIKGLDVPAQNGGPANGHDKKKDEEAPPVKEPPAAALVFFDNIRQRFTQALESKRPAPELLHLATLTQEALIILTIETLRYKPASVVKVHKLSTLVQHVKAIRTRALEALREMAEELGKIAGHSGTAAARANFVEACAPVVSKEIDTDFVLNVAKKVMDARKKVFEGIGKGVTKTCSTHKS